MAYECQNFKPGQILTAECLNKLDTWLAHICGKEIMSVEVNDEGKLTFTFCDGETLTVDIVDAIKASIKTETWEFTLENGTKVSKKVHVG